MKLRTTLAGLVTIAMLVLLLTPCAFAQVGASNAQVNGVVHDESGGSVARANVVLRETETNRTYTAVSNDNGLFVVTNLPPGRYELTTEAPGFGRATQTGILLTVGQVAPLRRDAVTPLARVPPAPLPRQRERDEAAVLREAISDEFDVESLLETDDALSYRRSGIGPEVVRKLRRGVWSIQAQLDLHGLRRDEAREQLAAFLREAVAHGLRCVRVIHGKGNGSPGREPVLKAKVKTWLVQKNEVLAFAQARAADGGHGALMVLLRPSGPGFDARGATRRTHPAEPERS